jgi:signal transduction histidine kinase
MDEPIELGRVEVWLGAIGGAIWAFVGLSRIVPGRVEAWWIAWALYGAGFIAVRFRSNIPRTVATLLLLLQSGSVFSMPTLGFGGFEGLLLSMVSAQVPAVLSFRAGVIWALVQIPPLFAIVAPYKNTIERLEILGAYSAFSAFALVSYWLLRRERSLRSELIRANSELLGARASLVESVREAERLRISRELHDSLGHHLTALSVQLELGKASPPAQMAEAVVRAHGVARNALTELRGVVKAIRSAGELDLASAIRKIAAELPELQIEIEEHGDPSRLDPESNHAVFRCVQEAITNSMRHSGAAKVRIRIERSGDQLEVDVRDDGKMPRELIPGRGLIGIQERMAQIGGRAEFRAETGLVVHLVAPARRAGGPR